MMCKRGSGNCENCCGCSICGGCPYDIKGWRKHPTNDAFGISMPNSILTNVSFNEGDIMMLDVSVKALGSGSTALLEVAC